jgi:hypothetical protein
MGNARAHSCGAYLWCSSRNREIRADVVNGNMCVTQQDLIAGTKEYFSGVDEELIRKAHPITLEKHETQP